MTTDREALEDALEAYALDMLDDDGAKVIEQAIGSHPDLVSRAAAIHRTMAAWAGAESMEAPPSLRDRVIDAAGDRRPPGQDDESTTTAGAVESYRTTVADLSRLIDELTDEDWSSDTIYRIPVIELISHLSGVEDYFGEVVAGRPGSAYSSTDHLQVRDEAVNLSDEAGVIERWRQNTAAIMEETARLPVDRLRSSVEFHGHQLTLDQLFVSRAFEVWTHTEDICRATGRAVNPPPPAVLRAMADVAIPLLATALTTNGEHQGKSLRVTLTGAGGGSWVTAIEAVDDGPGPWATADATIVADVVDFCRLFAGRVPPEELVAERMGDEPLLEDAVTLAPSFAEFGTPLT